MDDDCQDDIIISPSKNLNFLNQYFQSVVDEAYQDQQNNSNSNNEEDQFDRGDEKNVEKKKKKNKKKKRKRKEKKIMALHQDHLEEMLKSKLVEEE